MSSSSENSTSENDHTVLIETFVPTMTISTLPLLVENLSQKRSTGLNFLTASLTTMEVVKYGSSPATFFYTSSLQSKI